MDRKAIDICYLCGKPLQVEVNDDHVRPRQYYSTQVRKAHRPNLVTLPVHKQCNQGYQKDEDYFVYSLSPLAHDSYAGKTVLGDVFRRYRAGEKVKLARKVVREFNAQPGGIWLPRGKIAKRVERARISRVAWKIVRGLYFLNKGTVLPECTPRRLEIVPPGDIPPPIFSALDGRSTLGDYPGVFDYKYVQVPEVNDFYIWAMLLWDRIIMLMAFHNPDCECVKCKEARQIELPPG